MRNLFKSSAITSLLLLLLGVLLIFESEATITTISYIIGAILVAAGAFALIRFFSNKDKTASTVGLDILYGIVTIILGVLIVTNPHAIASLIPIVLGICIIISSAMKIQSAFSLKSDSNDLWKTTMIFAIIGSICGIVLLFNPFAGAVLIMRIVGIFIVIYAMLDFISTIIIKKNVEEFRNAAIESQIIEAEVVSEKEESKKSAPRKRKSSTHSRKKSSSEKNNNK